MASDSHDSHKHTALMHALVSDETIEHLRGIGDIAFDKYGVPCWHSIALAAHGLAAMAATKSLTEQDRADMHRLALGVTQLLAALREGFDRANEKLEEPEHQEVLALDFTARPLSGKSLLLLCPKCNGRNLHHVEVVVNDRIKEDGQGVQTRISRELDGAVETRMLTPGDYLGHRNDLRIRFTCEDCEAENAILGTDRRETGFWISFVQHKGESLIDVYNDSDETDKLKGQVRE